MNKEKLVEYIRKKTNAPTNFSDREVLDLYE